MLYLMHDLWHRHLIYYIWYLIHGTWYLTPALDMLYLIPDPRHLILDTGTWYTSYLSLDPDPRYMTHANPYLICFHVVQVHWPDIVTLDRTLAPPIPVLYSIFMTITFTGTWLLYCYQTFGTHVLLNSCIPEPLEKGNSWYYTPVDPRNRITMNIGLLRILCGHYHWTNYNN